MDQVKIGLFLKELRKEKQLTQEEVGEIKKTEIIPSAHHNGANKGHSVTYKISDLIKNINNGDFLKYAPDQLLSDSQTKLKNDAIEMEQNRINNLEKAKMS